MKKEELVATKLPESFVSDFKKIRSGSINLINIRGLQQNDRLFVELACNRAKFLVTNDPGLHDKHREFLRKCRFIVKYPGA